MGVGEILWLFFMLSALQPVLRQKMLEASRLRVLNRFEHARQSRAISLVHRQETMSLLGFPLMRYIDVNDSEEVLRAINLTDPDCPIDLILHTPGALVLAAGQIAHALKRHRAKVTVFVPHYAMSGGTLIALAADEIVMDPNAMLGPVDPQLGQSPAASVLSVLERTQRTGPGLWYSQKFMSVCQQPPLRSHSACGVKAGDADGEPLREHPASASAATRVRAVSRCVMMSLLRRPVGARQV